MKTRMVLAISRNEISVTYRCCKLPGYGRKCIERDDGYRCMRCRYCKAEMSGYDATRLLNKTAEKVWEDIKAGKGIEREV